MIICKWPDPLVDNLQVTEVTRGDRREGGEEGGEEGGGEEGGGVEILARGTGRTDGRTDQPKVVQEVLADLKTTSLFCTYCAVCKYEPTQQGSSSNMKLENTNLGCQFV